MFAELARQARLEQPELPALDSIVPGALVFAITEVVAEQVGSDRADRLPDLAPRLFTLVVRPLAGDRTVPAASRPRSSLP